MFLKRPSVNPTRIPLEREESVRWLEDLNQATGLLGDPARCVDVGDREADIFELFCPAQESGTHFLVRTCAVLCIVAWRVFRLTHGY
jgi:hypothetical protein